MVEKKAGWLVMRKSEVGEGDEREKKERCSTDSQLSVDRWIRCFRRKRR